jgi:hypothetical protein
MGRKILTELGYGSRRTLGDQTGSVIETRPDGYLIRLRPEQLDLLRFRSLADTARDAARHFVDAIQTSSAGDIDGVRGRESRVGRRPGADDADAGIAARPEVLTCSVDQLSTDCRQQLPQ